MLLYISVFKMEWHTLVGFLETLRIPSSESILILRFMYLRLGRP